MLKRLLRLAFALLLVAAAAFAQSPRTRLAVVGLDHDHVWGVLNTIAKEPEGELVAIADSHPELVQRAKARAPAGVKFFSDLPARFDSAHRPELAEGQAGFISMLDEMKPDAVIVTTANNLHLSILRECAKRHIHYFTEKPMAATGADAREMERLAREAGIKLMVNYWNAWSPATHELFHRVWAGELGPVNKIVVQYGHQGPKEIGVSKAFADWLYDPVKNGGGAIVDFGCYGAEWALWLKGRPKSVYAYTLKLKTEQHNSVDDDATILLEYPDATAVIQASWDWPYGKGEVEVYGPLGSLISTGDALFYRTARDRAGSENPAGQAVKLGTVPHETSNPIAYFLWCIRNDKPIENPVAPELNVGVNEILDAAKESIRTGRAVELR
jgi:predicted dehydrogenase